MLQLRYFLIALLLLKKQAFWWTFLLKTLHPIAAGPAGVGAQSANDGPMRFVHAKRHLTGEGPHTME